MKLAIPYLLLTVGVMSSYWTFSQDTLVLDASKDTYINTTIADQYQGQTQSFIAAGWTYSGLPGQGRSLMGFDVCNLPDSFELVSATLYLFHDYSSGHAGHTTNGQNSAKLFRITSPWDESTTWSSQPTFDANLFTSLPSSVSSSQDYTIDVTGIVDASIVSNNEIGFYFKLDQETTYKSLVFASRDHPDIAVRPRLELVYFTDTTWCGNPVGSPDYLEECLSNLVLPNVFTPNGDLINDVFSVEVDCVSSFEIHIFNRWGGIVYESDQPNFFWDGKLEETGLEAAEGTYFYRLTLSDQYGAVDKSGIITLLR